MLNWRITCLVLSFSFLLLGCCALEEYTKPTDPLTLCTFSCEKSFSHTVGNISNGTCKCPCEQGYNRSNGICISQLEFDKLAPARCTSACEKSFPHTVGNISNGTCKCPCEQGYQRYNGTCITLQEYDYLRPAICNSECAASIPHSVGSVKNGTCTCPCEKGYVSYNRTCITPPDFKKLAPVLCSEEYPVLKIYDWAYKGNGNYIYLCYKNESKGDVIEDRSTRRDYWNFVDDPYSNSSVSIVTDLLTNISERDGFSKYEQVEFAIAFVQSLPYTFDNVSTPYDNYPRFPSETIYDDGGDCEDTAILMAAILKKMGYDVVLLDLPRHLAIGVFCNPSDFNYTVASYPYNGRDYCYLETTGEGYSIGELPADMGYSSTTEVTVIPLRDAQPDIYIRSDYRYASHHDSHYTYIDVTGMHIDNYGSVVAKNAKIHVALETTEEGEVWDQYTDTLGDIQVRGYYNYEVTNLHIPNGEPFRVSITVYGDNFKSVESKSGWATWD